MNCIDVLYRQFEGVVAELYADGLFDESVKAAMYRSCQLQDARALAYEVNKRLSDDAVAGRLAGTAGDVDLCLIRNRALTARVLLVAISNLMLARARDLLAKITYAARTLRDEPRDAGPALDEPLRLADDALLSGNIAGAKAHLAVICRPTHRGTRLSLSFRAPYNRLPDAACRQCYILTSTLDRLPDEVRIVGDQAP